MRLVIFIDEKQSGTGLTKYPDDIFLFSNTVSDGNGSIIANYTGDDLSIVDFTGELQKTVIKVELTQIEFRRKFTLVEKEAMETARSTDLTLAVIMKDLEASPTVDSDHDDVTQGLAYLESEGYIGVGRAAEILSE